MGPRKVVAHQSVFLPPRGAQRKYFSFLFCFICLSSPLGVSGALDLARFSIMLKIIRYKLEFYDGPFNGGVRYYDSLSSALRVGRSYLTSNRDYPDRVGFDVYCLYSDYSSKLVFSEIG